jgi:pSer/pThr/pTyr-binding forkhead associated (FHA) protein
MGTARLIGLSPQLRGQIWGLTREKYVIGRVESCDICIPDSTISSRHCTLTQGADGMYVLQDEGSTNGCRVNGTKVTTQALANGDILQVGSIELMYDLEVQQKAAKTQTVINLFEQKGNPSNRTIRQMTNISPFEKNTAKNDKLAIIWKVVIGVLAIGVAVVLFFIFQNLSSKPTPVPPGSPPATKTGK